MFLCDFTKCNGEQPSDKGTNICNRIKLTLEYEESENYLRNKAVRGGSKFDHGADKFIGEFNTIYQENNDIFNGLLCCLMHIFVEILSGNGNPQHLPSVLIFSLALE